MLDRRTMLAGSGAAAVAAGVGAWAGWRGMGSMTVYDAGVAANRATLRPDAGTRDLIRYATLAPGGHNAQPWTFEASGDAIVLRPDLARHTPVVDPDDHHLFASLGAAAETLALAAAARGRAGELVFDPAEGGTVRLADMGGAGDSDPALFDAIPHRQSTRGEYDGTRVALADLATLVAAAAVPGVDLVLINERRRIEQVTDLVIAGNDTQMADPAFLGELKDWLRFNPRTAMATGDGHFAVARGLLHNSI